MKKIRTSIVPPVPGKSPNYWCTWGRQNSVEQKHEAARFFGDQGAKLGRDNLNEECLFREGGWADYFPECRSDLFFVLDDGWDVPYDTHPDKHLPRFGSGIPDQARFPGFQGTAPQRLKQINRALQRRGWRGLGLWIAAQAQGESWQKTFTPEQQKAYWTERLKWAAEAEIGLWKVDWGIHGGDLDFRRLLTELAKEFAPDLLLEHCVGSPCVNALRCQHGWDGSGRFVDMGGNIPRAAFKVQQFSGMTRFYDLSGPLKNAAAMDRLAFYLMTAGTGWLNVEDMVYMGASAGCPFGVMRSPHNKPSITGEASRCREVGRALRWQRIAPAFRSGEEQIRTASRILTDTWKYSEKDTWDQNLIGRLSRQSAPWGIARNMPLPEVQPLNPEEDLPFITAALNPNGAVSVAVAERVQAGRGFYQPECSLRLPLDCSNRTIGIFGTPERLELPVSASRVRVTGQDLAEDSAFDLSEECPVVNGTLLVTRELIQKITIREPGDVSAPGTVLRIEPY